MFSRKHRIAQYDSLGSSGLLKCYDVPNDKQSPTFRRRPCLNSAYVLSLGTPWPRRHEDPLKLRGNHSPKYTISYLWRQIFSNTDIRTSHIRYLGLRNRHSPELGTNTEKYGSTFTQPPCIQTVTGTNLDRYTNCRDRLSWFSQSFPSPIIPSLDAIWHELLGKSNYLQFPILTEYH